MSAITPPAPDAVDTIVRQWADVHADLPVESIHVVARILRIAKVLTDHRRRSLAALGIDSATFDLLATLRRHSPSCRMTPAQLTHACLVTGGAITQRVSRAEAAGLVEVDRGQGGRSVTVALTDQGRQRIDHDIAAFLAGERDLISHLDPSECDQLTDLLRTLLAGLPQS